MAGPEVAGRGAPFPEALAAGSGERGQQELHGGELPGPTAGAVVAECALGGDVDLEFPEMGVGVFGSPEVLEVADGEDVAAG